jgi:hypothetical protein
MNPKWTVLALLLAACTPADSGTDDETAGDDDTTTGSTDVLPPECSDLGSPFLEEDCLGALQSACRAYAAENECTGQAPFVFGDGAYVVHCGWAKLVTFSDAETCTVESVAGRCEAGLEDTLSGCGDPCVGEPDINHALSAIPSELVLLEMACTPGGNRLDGPLSPTSAVDSELENYTGTCAPNIEPPAPALCDCAPVACEAG